MSTPSQREAMLWADVVRTPLEPGECEALRRHAAEVDDWALGVLIESALWNIERLQAENDRLKRRLAHA
jgi:hypothetical protein